VKRLILLSILIQFFISCKNDTNPNILIILTDDQGWGDLSINGNTNLKTPNIDNIALNGASFERFYVSPVCSPTRAELLSGKFFVRSGVNGVTRGYERMNTDVKLISDFFKGKKYKTGAFGKWHNGSQPPYHPNNRGFDEFYGFTSGHWGNYFDPILEKNGKIIKTEGYINDVITNEAISFIKKSNKPFLSFISYNTPHSPMQVPDKYFDGKDILLRGRYSKRENIEKTKAAMGMIENIDENIGNVIRLLKEKGVYENTIIIFFSDNGPNGNRWNNDLKDRKGSTNEGGVRVPFFIQWPKNIKKGLKIKQISSVLDVFPTLLELTGNESLNDLDGMSLKRFLDSPSLLDDERTIFSYWNNRISARNNNYILDHENNLYDLVKDFSQYNPIEKDNNPHYQKLLNDKNEWLTKVVNPNKEKLTRRPFTINYNTAKYTHLPARDAEINGDLKRSSIHANCSFIENWKNTNDYIFWEIDVLEDGINNIELYYTLEKESVGTEIALEFENQIIKKTIDEFHDPNLVGFEEDKIKRIESYTKDFKKIKIGTMSFKKGLSKLKLKTTKKVGKKSIDFRLLILKNENEKNS
tara:strand:- start:1361 stop:3109 length:1749 start_codon:yes stop_codon:yes gene_type:complete